jgi:hypothetical protein
VETPFLTELVRRMRLDNATVTVDIDRNGAGTVRWQDRDIDHPLILRVRERDLAAAVTAMGEDCRDELWPDSSIEEAGFNLLLAHLDEVVATRETSEPLRLTDQGLEWPEARRHPAE